MVMAHSLYRFLAQREDVELDVLAPAWSLPLLARMPEVKTGIELPLGHGELGWGVRRAVGRRLREGAYERAIVLPRSLKASLVPFFARIPVRTGYRGEWRFGLINDMRSFDAERDQTVLRFLALGLHAGEALPSEPPEPRLNADARSKVFARLGLRSGAGAVALIPGAEYGPAKRWPTEYFAGLAVSLAEAGIDVWLLGSAKEAPLGEAVVARAKSDHVRNLCGRTSLVDAVDLLAGAAVAVCNDSGLMHVAAAVGTHVVALYGSSSPMFTPPLTRRKTVIYRELSCSPCFARECPLQHLDCLRGIDVQRVLGEVENARANIEAVSPVSAGGVAPS
jgi:heptosyltransferase-2